MDLGNEQDARLIRDWYLLMQDHRRSSERPPVGFEAVGDGAYRAAFAGPGNVVYKVQHNYENTGQSNAGEARAIRYYYLNLKLPKGIRLPRFKLYTLDGKPVMAMERFSRTLSSYSSYNLEGAHYWRLRESVCSALNKSWDFHGANLAVDEATRQLVPIDLGGWGDEGGYE
jgi:hypothetical protein